MTDFMAEQIRDLKPTEDNTMPKGPEDMVKRNERSDKGTHRELTELAESVRRASRRIQQRVTDTTQEINDLLETDKIISGLNNDVKTIMNELEEEVRSFDQRDRLEKDKDN